MSSRPSRSWRSRRAPDTRAIFILVEPPCAWCISWDGYGNREGREEREWWEGEMGKNGGGGRGWKGGERELSVKFSVGSKDLFFGCHVFFGGERQLVLAMSRRQNSDKVGDGYKV